MGRVKSLAKRRPGPHAAWGARRPPAVADSGSPVREAPIIQLMTHLGLGWARWVKQFVYGFDIAGRISRMGEFPPGPTADQPCDISTIFETFRARIVTRSKIPGYLLEDILGERPRSRRNPDGWPNRAIDYSGTVLNSDFECQNADFRFSIAKPANGRAFGDLKYGLANRRCAPDTPTKLPTWDHIGQLGIRIRRNNRNFAFFEAGHEAAYKNPPPPGSRETIRGISADSDG